MFVYGILLCVTIITAFLSKFSINKMVVVTLLSLSGIKFLLVTFHFMELKKANPFWKVFLSVFLVMFLGIIALII